MTLKFDRTAKADIRELSYDDLEKPANIGELFRDESGALWMFLGIAWPIPGTNTIRVRVVHVVEVTS